MKWPEIPTCHQGENRYATPEHLVWKAPQRTRQPYGERFRRCGFCGSIHPEDLLNELKAGARLEGADMKYGWPHKFYVEGIPNLLAGQIVEIGSHTADGVTTPMMGQAPPTAYAKFYNAHLLDVGYDDDAFRAVVEALERHGGVRFELEGNGQLRWRKRVVTP